MQLLIKIPDDRIQDLINLAYAYGYMRDEPRKPWTVNEKKRAIRFALEEYAKSRGIHAPDARQSG